MAKILIAYFSDYGEAMYDAISDTLKQNGNDIFRLNINNSLVYKTKWGGISKIIDGELLNKLKKFNPDVVLNFNNCLPLNCYDILDEKCRICVMDADAPEVAFWNKDVIYKNLNRIFFLGLQSCSYNMYERYLDIKIDNLKYLYFPPATIVRKENLNKDKNISFIGSNFYQTHIPQEKEFYSNESLKLYDKLRENYFFSYKDAKIIYPECNFNLFQLIRDFYCGQERLKYMQQLTDLGFVFYGQRLWQKIAYYDFELAKCYNPEKITSIIDNQNVYNSSKISVNISHPLAQTSFSWRVMDIMASDSCLLMEDKPDWRDLFEKYLSKETLDSIIYKDRFDMRQKAIKLLNDDTLRKKCVLELNNAIEENGRWEIRFKQLEEFLGIKLLNNENLFPEIIFYQREEDKPKSESSSCESKNILQKLKLKNRCKIFFYSLMLALAQIPVLDLLQRRERRNKLHQKINKYWR